MTTDTTTEELSELRAVTRSFLSKEVPELDLRVENTGGYPYDKSAWVTMGTSLGLQGLIVPEDAGGLGLGIREVAVVAEELGRALYNGPYLTSAIIASSLLAAGNAGDVLLGELASGATIGAVVSSLLPGGDGPSVVAESSSDSTTVSGEERFAIGATDADQLLVPARTARGVAVFVVDATAAGVAISHLDSIDLLRPVARVVLTGAPGRLVIDEATSDRAIATARRDAQIALAAESVGAAARALEMTVEYVGQRVQFGRVIGAFQAVKHRCAEMLVKLESARSALFAAVNASDEPLVDQERLASLAKVTATDAFYFIASETVHLHGGIGFTWDHPAHLFYRRAKANQLLLGTRSQHERAIFQSLLPTYQYEGITK